MNKQYFRLKIESDPTKIKVGSYYECYPFLSLVLKNDIEIKELSFLVLDSGSRFNIIGKVYRQSYFHDGLEARYRVYTIKKKATQQQS